MLPFFSFPSIDREGNHRLHDFKWLEIYLFLLASSGGGGGCALYDDDDAIRALSPPWIEPLRKTFKNTWRFTSASYARARHLCRLKSLPDKIWRGSRCLWLLAKTERIVVKDPPDSSQTCNRPAAVIPSSSSSYTLSLSHCCRRKRPQSPILLFFILRFGVHRFFFILPFSYLQN